MSSLVSTTYSWTKLANILFLDQPVGVGFSYKRTPNIDKTSDTIEVVRIYEFLQKWLSQHPEFYPNPFYVAGDSYSGKIIPAIVQEISRGNYICCKPPINLQGYVLGNPITNLDDEKNYRIPYAHGMALISDELFESMKRICKGKYVNVDSRNTECLKLIENYEKCINKLFIYDVLLPNCDETSPGCFAYKYTLLSYWANDERVREALQISKGSIGQWERCGFIPYDMDIESPVSYHMSNSVSGYRSLIYR
uniref:Serine carboxypeptidase-like 12 n=1 Tax=Noccaea caerulescens TaxID=107243 RepID=A0A1J3J3K6_NOCCA